jgi:hypothetical protein
MVKIPKKSKKIGNQKSDSEVRKKSEIGILTIRKKSEIRNRNSDEKKAGNGNRSHPWYEYRFRKIVSLNPIYKAPCVRSFLLEIS